MDYLIAVAVSLSVVVLGILGWSGCGGLAYLFACRNDGLPAWPMRAGIQGRLLRHTLSYGALALIYEVAGWCRHRWRSRRSPTPKGDLL
jgi:hypothetical protein